ncbi:hypothetical protein AVEN_241593-1 [Araneus ventricosus]|uniref:C-type lectin domain-containing protein n=1 Tax=Araneus ventricosus TaxID=182803 RepID=A0A4Y2H9U2_ARAVE|nr:hypothetical protein AVEN_241593-1 [Araneus ventricosus]
MQGNLLDVSWMQLVCRVRGDPLPCCVHIRLYVHDCGLSLIWIGIRKRLGFYTVRAPVEYVFKIKNNSEQVLEWGNEEPVHDCVALNISSGHLVTQNCYTNLEYVCQNFGFPVYPVSKSLACPKEWLFFYQRQVGMLNCIQVFKSQPGRNAAATCLELRSQVADLRDFRELYDHMKELNISGYGVKGNGSNCEIKRIESVLGDHLKENLTCFDEIFICERNTSRISLRPKVSPDFSDSVEGATVQQSFLTCEVPFKSRDFSEIEDQLHYVWYKDEIPISVDSPVLNLSSYPEPVKQMSSYAIRQGTYSCVVTVEGIVDRFSSQYVNYFYIGLATYIVYMQTDLKNVLNADFSQDQSFYTLMRLLNNSISNFIENIEWHVQKPKWDYQMSWKNEKNVTVQLLFYNYFDDESYRYFDERPLEMDLKRKLLTNLSFNSSISLEVNRADTCFEQTVPSSSTSLNVTFLWRRTMQTKSAVSEPMCLNDWRLITRKCRPSVIWGATWGRVDVSQCTKYQFPLKDLELFCPAGFRNVDPNLCYDIHSEQKTFEEAEEACKNRSSVLEDFDPLLRIRRLLNPDPFETWLPNKRDLRNKEREQWLENNSSINKRNRTLLCATSYRNRTSSTWKCDSNERHPFVCVHHPFSLLKSFIFSKPWYRYSHKRASYYFEYSEKNWIEANRSCHAFPAQSTLLQSIRNLEEYSLFKVLLQQLRQDARETSWWMNLFQDGDSLKWLSSPEESPTFVDWEREAHRFLHGPVCRRSYYFFLDSVSASLVSEGSLVKATFRM